MTATDDQRLDECTVQLGEVEAVAIEACLAGGRRLLDLFESETTTDYAEHDVKSSADRASESVMLDCIQRRFPDHQVYAEESGDVGGDGDVHWIVDPLDGTNNFEAGLPTFASAVTVTVAGEPKLGVAYVPLLDDLYCGVAGQGVRYNGRPISTNAPPADYPVSAATVVSVIGHDVKLDASHRETSAALNRAVENRCKRRLETWSPTVHWGLLARGTLDGIYCYRPDREEQLLGELFADESGMITTNGPEWFIAGHTEAVHDALLEIVRGVTQ